eukprot:1191346-Prorocentrum_minimum.AAC.6
MGSWGSRGTARNACRRSIQSAEERTEMGLKTHTEVLQVRRHGALAVHDGHGRGVISQPKGSLVGPILLCLVSQHPFQACVELPIVAAGVGGAEVGCISLEEAVVMPMSPSSGACGISDVHGDVCMRRVSAQELVDAPLRVACVEAVLGGQAVEVVVAPRVSEEVSELLEVVQGFVRDHHVGAIAPIQRGGAVWGAWSRER